jgi:hypothetical protein
MNVPSPRRSLIAVGREGQGEGRFELLGVYQCNRASTPLP